MNINRRHLILSATGAAALSIGGISAARANVLDDIMSRGKIRAAINLADAPWGMLDENLKPTGYDVEIARMMAEDWGIELDMVETNGAGRVPNLQSGRAEIVVAALSITPQRAEVVDFSRPYAVIQLVVGGQSDIQISSVEDLKGQVVSVARGSVPDLVFSPQAEEIGYEIRRYDDYSTLITAGTTGQANLIGASNIQIQDVVDKDPSGRFETKIVMETFNLAMAVYKGEDALVAKTNSWITENIENGRIPDLFNKYFGFDLPEHIKNWGA